MTCVRSTYLFIFRVVHIGSAWIVYGCYMCGAHMLRDQDVFAVVIMWAVHTFYVCVTKTIRKYYLRTLTCRPHASHTKSGTNHRSPKSVHVQLYGQIACNYLRSARGPPAQGHVQPHNSTWTPRNAYTDRMWPRF